MISKMGDVWFETNALGLSEKIFDELEEEKFEGKLMGAGGEEHSYGFSLKHLKFIFHLHLF